LFSGHLHISQKGIDFLAENRKNLRDWIALIKNRKEGRREREE
jgi:hypothetical protein